MYSSAHRGLDISNYLQLISISLLVLGVGICTAGIKSELAHPFIVHTLAPSAPFLKAKT